MQQLLLFVRQFICTRLGFPLFSPLWVLRYLGARIGRNVFAEALTVEEQFAPLLTIEDNVVIAYGCRIILHDSALNNLTEAPIKFGRVIIRRGAYIGSRTTILPGVEIGERSLIGACSLVTHDIPPESVAYGVPARPMSTIHKIHQATMEKVDNQSPNIAYMNSISWRERSRFTRFRQHSEYRKFIKKYFGD